MVRVIDAHCLQDPFVVQPGNPPPIFSHSAPPLRRRHPGDETVSADCMRPGRSFLHLQGELSLSKQAAAPARAHSSSPVTLRMLGSFRRCSSSSHSSRVQPRSMHQMMMASRRTLGHSPETPARRSSRCVWRKSHSRANANMRALSRRGLHVPSKYLYTNTELMHEMRESPLRLSPCALSSSYR